ncbi:unnamed protein product [Trichogramma brassicae]|uniref:CCHC-type domain-containing protein n=1 Tax=Trichogramma brassicae TaxID=86971 RepID=A0A6H5HZX2_9HYME|nr:unnamed protein product [Trichogramma brassicae]
MAAAQSTAASAGLLNMKALYQNKNPLAKTSMLSWLSGGNDKQTKGNVHHPIILYTGCLEQAIIALRLAGHPESPGTTMIEAAPTQTVPTEVPTQIRKGHKQPATSPGQNRTPKRSTRTTRDDVKSTADRELDDNKNDVEDDFAEVKRRRDRHREAPAQGKPAARPGQHPQMAKSGRHAVQPRPDAIVVKTPSEGGATYADILRKLYANLTLQDTVRKSVKCIRHSPSGALVMQMNKGAENISALKSELEAAIGDTASASTLRHTTAIEIKDLDESATKVEIREALCTQLGHADLELDVVRSLRKAYAGTLTAVVALLDDVAAQAIKLGHIRIGWVSCRIRGRAEQLRCFRCWSPGHIAARCKGPHGTGLCYCCAKEGHQAKDCEAPPMCVFCRGQGADDHTSGGPRCPRAGETLQAPRK